MARAGEPACSNPSAKRHPGRTAWHPPQRHARWPTRVPRACDRQGRRVRHPPVAARAACAVSRGNAGPRGSASTGTDARPGFFAQRSFSGSTPPDRPSQRRGAGSGASHRGPARAQPGPAGHVDQPGRQQERPASTRSQIGFTRLAGRTPKSRPQHQAQQASRPERAAGRNKRQIN